MTRSEIIESILNDINAHLMQTRDIQSIFECKDGDERKNIHIWTIGHITEGQYWGVDETTAGIFLESLEQSRQRGDFDTGRFIATGITRNLSFVEVELTRWYLCIYYERRAIVRPPLPPLLPIDENAPIVEIGRYERTKKTLFASMFEYCVTKKLADGECCGGDCGSDRERGDAPNSYYMCENLHLLCYQCKQEWRVNHNKKGCPVCRNETDYQFVITPQPSQDTVVSDISLLL